MLKDTLGPWVLARTFSRWPLSEPRRSTVWFLWGPADVSTAIWVSLNLQREGSGSEAPAPQRARVHVVVAVVWICCRPQEAWADAELIVRRVGLPSITPSALASSVAYIL